MEEAIVSLMLLCSPLEFRTENYLLIQHNCHSINKRFVDETFISSMEDQPNWVKSSIPYTTRLVVATYYVNRDCLPTVKYAVIKGEGFGLYILVLQPNIFRDLDVATLTRAFSHLSAIIQWKREVNSGELNGCLR